MQAYKLIIRSVFVSFLGCSFSLLTDVDSEKIMRKIEAAKSSDDIESLKSLLQSDAAQNIINQKFRGATPLIQAAQTNNPEIIQLLLDAGADPTIKSEGKRGAPPLVVAAATLVWDQPGRFIHKKAKNTKKIAQKLIVAGADVNAQSGFGTTALMFAAKKGNKPLVVFLLALGADPTMKDKHGDNAINYAQHIEYSQQVKQEILQILRIAIDNWKKK